MHSILCVAALLHFQVVKVKYGIRSYADEGICLNERKTMLFLIRIYMDNIYSNL